MKIFTKKSFLSIFLTCLSIVSLFLSMQGVINTFVLIVLLLMTFAGLTWLAFLRERHEEKQTAWVNKVYYYMLPIGFFLTSRLYVRMLGWLISLVY